MEKRPEGPLKWIAGALLLAVVVGIAVMGRDEDPIPLQVEPPLPSAQPNRPPPPPEREEVPPVAEELVPPAPAPTPEPSVAPPMPPLPLLRGPKPPADPEVLARESALLDRARKEARSDPELALKSLIAHEQQFPGGSLENDAALIKIEALLRLNRQPEAEELARKLIDRAPVLEKPVQKLREGVRPR